MNVYEVKVNVPGETLFEETVVAEDIIPAIEKVVKKYEEKYGDRATGKGVEIKWAKLLGKDVIS